MKALSLCGYGVGVLLTLSASSASATLYQDAMPEIFSDVNGRGPATTQGCSASTQHSISKSDSETSWTNSGLQYSNTDNFTNYAGTSCTMYSTYDLWQINDGGHKVNEQQTTISTGGSVVYIQTCPPNEFADHKVPQYETEGSGQVTSCYKKEDLAEADSCSEPSTTQMFADTGASCMQKDDGSSCPVKETITIESSDGSGSLGLYKFDPDANHDGSCYLVSNDLPVTMPEPTDSYCESYGNGVTMCNENEADMCDSQGNCQTGCGTVDFGNGAKFVCLADDRDDDGVPDYSDTDIDGDGITNELDEDWDGDGKNDPAYGSGRGGSAGTIGTPTGSGTGSSSGSGGGGSAIDTSGIEEGLDNLTEDGDFSGTSHEQGMSDDLAQWESKLQAFNETEELNLSNAVSESGLSAALDPSSIFSGGCSASFGIPFSGESIDLCEPAATARPYLYVIFAFATFVFCTRQIVTTVRGTE